MRWMWIDQIVKYEPGRTLWTVKNVSLAEEHLHDDPALGTGDAPVMPASLIIEGMAQTAGILVGAANEFREKVVLAKIVKARFDREVSPGQTIRYEATLDRLEKGGASTSGIVRRRTNAQTSKRRNADNAEASEPSTGMAMVGGGDEWEAIGTVDLMFGHVDHNAAGAQFPKENFVFSDNFKMILRAAGMAY